MYSYKLNAFVQPHYLGGFISHTYDAEHSNLADENQYLHPVGFTQKNFHGPNLDYELLQERETNMNHNFSSKYI